MTSATPLNDEFDNMLSSLTVVPKPESNEYKMLRKVFFAGFMAAGKAVENSESPIECLQAISTEVDSFMTDMKRDIASRN